VSPEWRAPGSVKDQKFAVISGPFIAGLDAVSRCLGADFRVAAEQDGPLCLAAPQAQVWLRAQDAELTGPGGTGVPVWLPAAVWLPHEWELVGSQVEPAVQVLPAVPEPVDFQDERPVQG
jgi:hypothetical protein